MTLQTAALQRELIRIDWERDELPTMPFVAQRLLGLIGKKEVEVQELEETIGQDPALTMKLLQVCNSALYSLNSEVTSIRHAINLLGRENIIQIAVSALLAKQFMTVPAELKDEAKRLWKHLITTAVLARDFLPDVEEPDLYTLALLHDVGWLVLMSQAPKVFLALKNDIGTDIDDIEERWGIDHQLWGGKLLEKWALPEPFQVVALRHHEPLTETAPPPYLLVISLSNYLANAIGNNFIEYQHEEFNPGILRAMNLDPDIFDEMVQGAMAEKERINSYCAMLSG